MSTSKTIYLIRHGQTEFNKMGIAQGSGVDAPLNETGVRQADAFYEAYKHVDFSRVYTSKLIRSIQSVERFLEKKIPHESHAGLNEISWGSKDGLKVNFNENMEYLNIVQKWREGDVSLGLYGGESPQQVMDRQKPVVEKILTQEMHSNVLVCMHGRAIRILLCLLTGAPLSQMDDFEHANLGLYLLEYDGEKVKILKNNDTTHLKDMSPLA